jgi:hypothetical protein
LGELRTAGLRNRGGAVVSADGSLCPVLCAGSISNGRLKGKAKRPRRISAAFGLTRIATMLIKIGLTKGAQLVRHFVVTWLLIVGKRIAVGG